jgi:peptidyl-prolyl cis-trans isomerase SurA
MKMHRYIFLICSMLVPQAAGAAQMSLDKIIAIVDESVVTERDLTNRIQLIKLDFAQSSRRLPNTNLSDFRKSLISQGLDYDKYRETIRRELTIANLSRQYGQRYATISDAEVDEFIKLSGGDNSNYEYRLSHILIALPDAATPEQIEEAHGTAMEILSHLDQGAQFDELANTFSTGDTALKGGDLGWRKRAEIPSLFTAQIITMEPGDHAGPIRSANGFHIIFLREQRDLEITMSKQTRSRHILLRSNELVTEDDARQRLLEFRERIEAGEDFARLARLYSVDYSSGVDGGDIGWNDPGSTVREYEEAANQLEEGELSEPVRSQFGWHLIEVTGRRTIDETQQNKRNKIHSQLLQQKQREVFDLWKRRLRDEAYVVFPGQPDA